MRVFAPVTFFNIIISLIICAQINVCFFLLKRLFDKAHMYDDVEDVTFDNVFKEVVKYSDLCPLSPFSLFNIKVNPKNLDFGLVRFYLYSK